MQTFLSSIGADQWLLPAMLFWPIVAAFGVRLIGRSVIGESTSVSVIPGDSIAANVPQDLRPSAGPDARSLTLGALIIEAVLGLMLWSLYRGDQSGWQARVDFPWISDLGATFSVGVDGLSLVMLLMTVLLMPLSLAASWNNVRSQTPSFGALVLLLTSGLVGVFISLDLLLFYVAWELMLIPMYFLIGIWGGAGRTRASIKYVLFTFVGSLLMLVAIIALWNLAGARSFHIDDLVGVSGTLRAQLLMFGAFFLAFGVKSALVPFHTWMPDAQAAAPTLAAVALSIKVGTYAILRFAIPLFPVAAQHPTLRTTILVLSVIAILYGAIVAMSQRDLKRLISYSSISHMGLIMLGCFIGTAQSVQGAVMVMLASGVTTGALFLLAGMLQDRSGTTQFDALGGLARAVPAFSVMLMLAMLSTIALPGTNGFIGEFLVLLGTYQIEPAFGIVATLGVIFAAVYGLRALQQLLFNANPREHSPMHDLSRGEFTVMAVFAIAILWLGLAPQPILLRLNGGKRPVASAAQVPVPSTRVGAVMSSPANTPVIDE